MLILLVGVVRWSHRRQVRPVWWRRWYLHVWSYHARVLSSPPLLGEEALRPVDVALMLDYDSHLGTYIGWIHIEFT